MACLFVDFDLFDDAKGQNYQKTFVLIFTFQPESLLSVTVALISPYALLTLRQAFGFCLLYGTGRAAVRKKYPFVRFCRQGEAAGNPLDGLLIRDWRSRAPHRAGAISTGQLFFDIFILDVLISEWLIGARSRD